MCLLGGALVHSVFLAGCFGEHAAGLVRSARLSGVSELGTVIGTLGVFFTSLSQRFSLVLPVCVGIFPSACPRRGSLHLRSRDREAVRYKWTIC